jgi:hypothetical protein
MGACWPHSPEYVVTASVAYRSTAWYALGFADPSLFLVFERMCLSIRHPRYCPKCASQSCYL